MSSSEVPHSTQDAAMTEGLHRDGSVRNQDSPREDADTSLVNVVAPFFNSDEEWESWSSSSLSSLSCISEDTTEGEEGEKRSSDTEEEEEEAEDVVKRPHLDQDLVTDWYEGAPFRRRDQRQCNEYFLRGRSLIRCFRHLQDGHALDVRHSRRLSRTLYAGKHNTIEHRTKNSEYVRRAKAEYEALLLILHRQHKALLQQYVVATLVAVQKSHLLVFYVRLMEVLLLLLQEEDTGVEDLHTLVGLCRQLEFTSLGSFLRRPMGEVLVGAVHSLLYRMRLREVHVTLHRQHRCIYQLACAPVFGMLGYHGAPPRPDTALLYNNSAKVFQDYLGEEAHLLLLVALHASLLTPELGPLSDLLLDRLARAARICPAPPHLLKRLERHLHATDGRPGPKGCVALLRLLRRCHQQLGQLQDLPALLQRIVALLVADNDRPMTAARDLGRLLLRLRIERPVLLQATVEAGKAAIKERLDGDVDEGVPLAAAQHFLVNMVRLVVGAARAVPLPPSTGSEPDGDSDWESDNPEEQEVKEPSPEEVAATLLGLCGRQAEPRASWSSLGRELSHLLLPRNSGPQDCLAVNALLHLATGLHDHKDDDTNRPEETRDDDNDELVHH